MKRTLLLTLLLLCLPVLAHAQGGTGFFLVGPGQQWSACTQIPNPQANLTWCGDGNNTPNYTWRVWTGSAYVSIGGAGAGGIQSLNAQTGASFPNQFFGNDANVTISSAGGVHTLGWTGCLPVSRGGIGACAGVAPFFMFFETNSTVGESILAQETTNVLVVHPGTATLQTLKTGAAVGGAGAAFLVRAGNADTGSGAVGGALALAGGLPDGAHAGGFVQIDGAEGTPGGAVTITAGQSTTGAGPQAVLKAGDSLSGVGGDAFVVAGNGTGGLGGNVVIAPGSGTTTGNVTISALPDGNVIINGLTYPLADGTAGQAIVTDGAGTLSFASGGTGTVTGSGTTNTVPIWTSASALGDSGITDDGTVVTVQSTGGSNEKLVINEGGVNASHLGNNNLGGVDTQALGEQIDFSGGSELQGVGNQITGTGSDNQYLGEILDDGGLSSVVMVGQQMDLTGLALTSQVVIGSGEATLSVGNTTVSLGPDGTLPVLKFWDSAGIAGNKFVGFQAPNTVTTSATWVLPAADGANGTFLTTDGAGNLAWAAGSGASGITSINGLSAAVQTVAAGSTNINWSSAVATHTFTWTGQLSNVRGGTGQDSSAWSALPLVTAGTWSQYAGSSCSAGQIATAISASGVLTCGAASGSGTVTHTLGALNLGRVIIGNGGADITIGPGADDGVYFAQGGGLLSQDASHFGYDSSKNTLKLGFGGAFAAAPWGSPPLLASPTIEIGNATGATGPTVTLTSSNGTFTSPTPSTTGDTLGTVDFRGYDGTSSISGATIKTVVQSSISSGIIPTNIVFETTDIGGAKHQPITLRNNGNVVLGGKLIRYQGFAPVSGSLLIGNASSGAWDANVLSAGPGISITNGPGTIQISSSGSGSGNVIGSGAQGTAAHWTGPGPSNLQGAQRFVYVDGFGVTRQAIQDAINFAVVGGAGTSGVVQLDCRTYTLDGVTISITHTVTLQGCASKGGNGTRLIGSGVAPIITVSTADSSGTILKDMVLLPATNGVGISMATCQSCRILNVEITGPFPSKMATSIALSGVTALVIDSLSTLFYNTSGISITSPGSPDSGDNTILNSTFFSDATTGGAFTCTTCPPCTICWTSGGGLRIFNNKFLGNIAPGGSIIDLHLTTGNTGDIQISNNSIEWGASDQNSGFGVRVRPDGGTTTGYVSIVGNQFSTAFYKTAISFEGIAANISTVNVTGNSMNTFPANGSGIFATEVDRIVITGNVINGNGATTTGVNLAANVFNACAATNAFGSVTTKYGGASSPSSGC